MVLGLLFPTEDLNAATSNAKIFPQPTIASIFPLGGQQGTEIQLEIRGEALDGAYAVLFESKGVEAQVRHVAKIEPESKEPANSSAESAQEKKELSPVFLVSVQVTIAPSVSTGVHSLRLISPRGVSNPLHFRVDEHAVAEEADTPHSSMRESQQLKIPAIINGRISQHGEWDYYAFEASTPQELSFEIDLAHHFEPRIALYQPTPSWLDPDRPKRLLFDGERETDLMPLRPRFLHRVEPGRYLIEVGSLFGKGGPDCGYQLRILPAGESDHEQKEAEWQERLFTRKIEPGWIQDLWARTLRLEDSESESSKPPSQTGPIEVALDSTLSLRPQPPERLVRLQEVEPNELPKQAQNFAVGTMIDGSISTPGDRDTFQFEAEAGQQLVFEVATPQVAPPHFNPRLELRSEDGSELLTSVHLRKKRYGGGGIPSNYLKAVEPKMIYSVERNGRYTLEIRDVTSRYGDADYVYRLVVRNQIPHVGAFEVNPHDRINLIPGRAKKVNVITYQEEGFSGEVLFTFSGLPQGVTVSPGAEVDGKKGPDDVSENEESFVPVMQTTTLVLLADSDAPITRKPLWLSLKARPVVGGQVGATLPVAEIPLMVVQPDPVHLSKGGTTGE